MTRREVIAAMAGAGMVSGMAPDPSVAVSAGAATDRDPASAASRAVAQALAGLGGAPVRGLIFYEYFPRHPRESEIGRIVHELARGAPSIGVRAIPHCSEGTLWEDSVGVLAIGGDAVEVRADWQPLEDDRLAMGRRLGRNLMAGGKPPVLAVVLSEPNLSFAPEHVSVEEFLRGMHETLGDRAMVFGGNGYPDADERCWQFLSGEAAKSHAAAMSVSGPLRFIGANANEFEPVGEKLVVTRSSGKWIQELNGRPAASEYRRMKGLPPDAPLTYDSTDPLAVDLGDGNFYLRMILFEKKAQPGEAERKRAQYMEEAEKQPIGAIRVIAAIPEGTQLRAMRYLKSDEAILRSAQAAMDRLWSQVGDGERPLVILTSSCCARRSRLRSLNPQGDEVRQGLRRVAPLREVPVFGLDAFGELGPIGRTWLGRSYQYQQHTLVAGLLVASRDAHRA